MIDALVCYVDPELWNKIVKNLNDDELKLFESQLEDALQAKYEHGFDEGYEKCDLDSDPDW